MEKLIQVLGVLSIMAPFIALTIYMISKSGVGTALLVWGLTVMLWVPIVVGKWLLDLSIRKRS